MVSSPFGVDGIVLVHVLPAISRLGVHVDVGGENFLDGVDPWFLVFGQAADDLQFHIIAVNIIDQF